MEESVETKDWLSLFEEEMITKEVAKRITKKVFAREQFLSLRFRTFIERNLPESFWTSPDSRAKELDDYIDEIRREYFGEDYMREHSDHFHKWWWLYTPEVRITRGELGSILTDIYNMRSRFSHVGKSPPSDVVDIYETVRVRVDVSNAPERIEFVRSPPSFFWFERVVNESIGNFVMQHPQT